jgi:hypothetical protein
MNNIAYTLDPTRSGHFACEMKNRTIQLDISKYNMQQSEFEFVQFGK